MCGKALIPSARDLLMRQFSIDEEFRADCVVPHDEAKPGDWIYAIVRGNDGQRILTSFQWGFGPDNTLYNARIETAHLKPTWKDSFLNRRCIIPLAGFYERNQLIVAGHQVLTVAGIWQKEPTWATSILTKPSYGRIAKIHDRMPAIVHIDDIDDWLDPNFDTALAKTSLYHHQPTLHLSAA